MPSSPTPVERSLAAKIAAHESWAQTEDRSARTAKARNALEQKFLDQAGGDPEKYEQIRAAFYTRIQLKSAKARRKAKEAREQANRYEQEAAEADAAMRPFGGAA